MRAELRKQKKMRGIVKRALRGKEASPQERRFFNRQVYTRIEVWPGDTLEVIEKRGQLRSPNHAR